MSSSSKSRCRSSDAFSSAIERRPDVRRLAGTYGPVFHGSIRPGSGSKCILHRCRRALNTEGIWSQGEEDGWANERGPACRGAFVKERAHLGCERVCERANCLTGRWCQTVKDDCAASGAGIEASVGSALKCPWLWLQQRRGGEGVQPLSAAIKSEAKGRNESGRTPLHELPGGEGDAERMAGWAPVSEGLSAGQPMVKDTPVHWDDL